MSEDEKADTISKAAENWAYAGGTVEAVKEEALRRFTPADANDARKRQRNRECSDREMTMSNKTTTKSRAPLDEAAAVSLLQEAGYHVVALRNGGYAVIDLACMSAHSECRDLAELISSAEERAEEVTGPHCL